MNNCICIHDISENYKCSEKTELQAMYYQKTEVTVYVTIIHRHALLEYDGVESTEEDPQIVSETFYVISPDLQHDHHFVHNVQTQVRDYLSSISYNAQTMHEYTDGCSCRYKSRHC